MKTSIVKECEYAKKKKGKERQMSLKQTKISLLWHLYKKVDENWKGRLESVDKGKMQLIMQYLHVREWTVS